MPRYAITIEYDGTPFVGWQIQNNGPTVQAAIARALQAMTGEDAIVQGAGRTDTGVHALGQVAHFDLSKEWPADTLRDGLNFHLKPDPVAIIEVTAVSDDFHARFSATARHYRYRIVNRRGHLTLDVGRAWQVPKPLDAAAMHAAAQCLAGHHDFTTFRSAHCQARSPMKTLDKVTVDRTGDEIDIHVSARSFLHRQVRSLVGSLRHVGEGKWTADDLRAALEAADRAACGPVAPADGLYLVSVGYDRPED